MQDIALSLAMLMVLALPVGALVLWRRGGPGKQVALMLVLAVVMAANVAIWVLPTSGGSAPVGQRPD
ncbi:hypothetical protein ACFOON_15460 [Novosphingobium piscinae]|uniref:Uncharacterized protein n=1 Tax=Novosphingobium piscinae TaxID=1507448 RepID=A0A7X1FXE0_9SPHN|nr:hypothetical protein [Novosphingobium piscinae]MBC2668703.1 hypothetical protein [Novosphingobium piscinae]